MTRPRMLGLLGAFLSLSIYSTAQEKPAEIRLTIKYDGRIVPNPGHITVNSKNYVASVAVTNGKFTVPIEISRAKTWSFAVVVLGNQMQMLDLSQSELKYEDWTLCLADHHFNEECIHALPKDTDVRSSCVLVLDSERIDPGLTILQRPCRRRKKLVSQPVNAEEARAPLPKVVSASVPFYPRLAPSARIQGAVTLRLSTDGKSVSAIDAESGPPMLVNAAKENVKTWQFEPHAPTTFEVEFRYRLLDPKCDSECKCESEEKESVVLQLPTNVDVSGIIPAICDPAEKISKKEMIWRRFVRQLSILYKLFSLVTTTQ